MSVMDGWILGLLVASVSLGALCLLALMAVIESLKDVRAYQFTVIERLGNLDARIRDGHLRILKCLKGESYEGTIGGMDIHTDPNVPTGGGLMFSRDAFNTTQAQQ